MNGRLFLGSTIVTHTSLPQLPIASALGTHPSDLLAYRTRDVLDTLHVCWVVPTMNGIIKVGIGIGRSQGCMPNEIHSAGRDHEEYWS